MVPVRLPAARLMCDHLALSPGLDAWELLVADRASAAAQMRLDEQLARRARPTLRLFRWAAPAVSLGFRQVPPDWAGEERLAAHGIERVERPTGGGIAVHGSDLSCSVTVPMEAGLPLREVMAGVCDGLSEGLRAFGAPVSWRAEVEHSRRIEYCLTEPSPYAIMAGDRKVCGLAIRRYPESWLIQGSLLARPLPSVFERVMPPAVREAFGSQAVCLQEAVGRAVEDTELAEQVMRAWGTAWGIDEQQRGA